MSAKSHKAFVPDLLAKIGAPVFAATFVGCVLKEEVQLTHAFLLALGLGLIYYGHRQEYHHA
ncbi:MAG: hypothetical protein DWQ01_05515 [Planctomycetota bacterium]|nr:MAG: hypothetical protein DWQ01_05515 [Planctomycetota bacterium]